MTSLYENTSRIIGFLWEIHPSPINLPNTGLCGDLMFYLMLAQLLNKHSSEQLFETLWLSYDAMPRPW